MATHFRDFNDPNIDPVTKVLNSHQGLLGWALTQACNVLLGAIGVKRSAHATHERWVVPYSGDKQAVIDVYEPSIVKAAWFKHHDLGVFYTFTGDERGQMWRPNTELTTVADEVNTGYPNADSLVAVVTALTQRGHLLRSVGRTFANLLSPVRDSIARARWQQDPKRTKAEIWAHYDIDPRIYTGKMGFLDDGYVQYSSGLLDPGRAFESLEDLQEKKVHELIRKLQLDTAKTVLEIGGGWGGLAVAIAQAAPKVHITSLTVSDEQLTIAKQRATNASVSDRVQFLGEDYRTFQPEHTYDRVVSVEMIEAVDWRDLDTYFDSLNALVNPDKGIVVLQAITVRKEKEASQHHRPSFINTAIFPGGCLTSVETITSKMTHRGFRLQEQNEMGDSYALTLREWLRRFNKNIPALTQIWKQEGLSDSEIYRFVRGFNLYLAACEAGFRPETGPNIGVQQLVFARV